MNFRSERQETPDINLTALIDVVFLLLIFFMVSTTFTKEAEIQLELPEAEGELLERKAFTVEISVDSLGRYFVNQQRVKNNKIETLKRAITLTIAQNKNPNIIISSDKNTPYQSVVTVMDAVRQLGFNKFSLTTKKTVETE